MPESSAFAPGFFISNSLPRRTGDIDRRLTDVGTDFRHDFHASK